MDWGTYGGGFPQHLFFHLKAKQGGGLCDLEQRHTSPCPSLLLAFTMRGSFGSREGGLSSLSTLSSPPSSIPLACLPGTINGEPASGQECMPGWAPQSCTLRERPAPGHPAAFIYIYIASGNPIQPAPAPVFKHPALAQAGPVASSPGVGTGHVSAGGGDMPQGQRVNTEWARWGPASLRSPLCLPASPSCPWIHLDNPVLSLPMRPLVLH